MNKLKHLLGIDTLSNVKKIIQQNNGIKGTFLFMLRYCI